MKVKKIDSVLISVLLLASVFIFRQIIFFGKTVGDLDAKLAFLPIEIIYRWFQDHGQMPWWTTSLGFGQPAIGWGQLGYFIPVHLAMRLMHFSPVAIVAFSPVVYTAIGLVGAFIFLRARAYHSIAAAAGASIFSLNGFVAGHVLHTNFYVATMMLPLLLWAVIKIFDSPSLFRAMFLAIFVGIIAENGQPQIVFFTFLISLVIFIGYFVEILRSGMASNEQINKVKKILSYSILAGILGIGLASVRILPLMEFLSQTERGSNGLKLAELYEFSIPVWNSITLVLPRFFFGTNGYWGESGFIEMAIYTGIIPLMVAGAALVSWRRYGTDKILGAILLVFGITMALGKASLFYRWIITKGFLVQLGGTGRFSYFAMVGLTLLVTVGLHEWINGEWRKRNIFGLFLLPVIFIVPFVIKLVANKEFQVAFGEPQNIIGIFEVATSAIAVLLLMHIKWFRKSWKAVIVLLIILASFCFHHGDFYSLEPRISLTGEKFASVLRDYRKDMGVPARILAKTELLLDKSQDLLPLDRKPTPVLAPDFIVVQKIHSDKNNLSCLMVPVEKVGTQGMLRLELRQSFEGKVLRTTVDGVDKNDNYPGHLFCFDPVLNSENKDYWIWFASDEKPLARLLSVKNEDVSAQACFLSTNNPTPGQIKNCRKNVRVLAESIYGSSDDIDLLLLKSHSQAAGEAGSANWWGALPNERYNQFIIKFFGNDRGMGGGEKGNLLERYRSILDMAGVTHLTQLVTRDATDLMPKAGFDIVKEEEWRGHKARLYYNKQVFPKAFLVPSAVSVTSMDQAFSGMDNPSFDPSKQVFIEGDMGVPPISEKTLTSKVEINKYKETEIEIRVDTSDRAVLVLNDVYNPNWQAKIDGKIQPKLIANGLFRAVVVPTGMHNVTFVYVSLADRNGFAISIVSVIVIVLSLVIGSRDKIYAIRNRVTAKRRRRISV